MADTITTCDFIRMNTLVYPRMGDGGRFMNSSRHVTDKMLRRTDDNYNRYVYIGNKYKSREELLEINEQIVKFFDIMLFTGSRHFKRGHGLSVIQPERFGTIYKEKKRKKTQCGMCGQLGHNSRSCNSKIRIICKQKETSKKKCVYCGKLDKGHVCKRFEIDKQRIREILLFFKYLF